MEKSSIQNVEISLGINNQNSIGTEMVPFFYFWILSVGEFLYGFDKFKFINIDEKLLDPVNINGCFIGGNQYNIAINKRDISLINVFDTQGENMLLIPLYMMNIFIRDEFKQKYGIDQEEMMIALFNSEKILFVFDEFETHVRIDKKIENKEECATLHSLSFPINFH